MEERKSSRCAALRQVSQQRIGLPWQRRSAHTALWGCSLCVSTHYHLEPWWTSLPGLLYREIKENGLHFNDFPTVALQKTAPLKLLCPGGDQRRVPNAHQRKGNTESTVCPLCKASQQGGNNQVFMWHGAYRGQPQYCPHSPLSYPGLIVPLGPTHGHVAKPPQTKTCAPTSTNNKS